MGNWLLGLLNSCKGWVKCKAFKMLTSKPFSKFINRCMLVSTGRKVAQKSSTTGAQQSPASRKQFQCKGSHKAKIRACSSVGTGCVLEYQHVQSLSKEMLWNGYYLKLGPFFFHPLQSLRCGTTGVVTFIRGNMLHVAWLGDSQVMLVRRGQAVELMKPHKPDREVRTACLKYTRAVFTTEADRY